MKRSVETALELLGTLPITSFTAAWLAVLVGWIDEEFPFTATFALGTLHFVLPAVVVIGGAWRFRRQPQQRAWAVASGALMMWLLGLTGPISPATGVVFMTPFAGALGVAVALAAAYPGEPAPRAHRLWLSGLVACWIGAEIALLATPENPTMSATLVLALLVSASVVLTAVALQGGLSKRVGA